MTGNRNREPLRRSVGTPAGPGIRFWNSVATIVGGARDTPHLLLGHELAVCVNEQSGRLSVVGSVYAVESLQSVTKRTNCRSSSTSWSEAHDG